MQAAPFRMNLVQYLSCRLVCHMKSMRVQRGYICLPSLCLHYVELNKRIISKTAALWTSSAICGGLLFSQAGRAV